MMKISQLRHKFICMKQTLIPRDLHICFIAVNKQRSHRIIDSEFVFYDIIDCSLRLNSKISKKLNKLQKELQEFCLPSQLNLCLCLSRLPNKTYKIPSEDGT